MPTVLEGHPDAASVVLYWLPLGDGGRSVRWNGRAFEVLAARHAHRAVRDLYHSALEVHLGPDRFVIEMTPAWGGHGADRGVVAQGPVGSSRLEGFALFRYEVRRWHNGVITDVAEAVASPVRVGADATLARRLLELVPSVPVPTWGRDEMHTGDMWNSNSLTAWLLARSGHDMDAVQPPAHGRAPGWHAGLVAAARQRGSDGQIEDPARNAAARVSGQRP